MFFDDQFDHVVFFVCSTRFFFSFLDNRWRTANVNNLSAMKMNYNNEISSDNGKNNTLQVKIAY